MRLRNANRPLVLAVAVLSLHGCARVAAQTAGAITIRDVLAPPFPVSLASARAADRVVWIEYEEGRRNVYTAVPPDFQPVRLTEFTEDDGVDLGGLQVSRDGSVVLFTRGHSANREGWIANPGNDPAGGVREVWAVRMGGGPAWSLGTAAALALSPDGRWGLYRSGQGVYRKPIIEDGEGGRRDELLFKAYGSLSNITWSPDGKRIGFVTDRESHSFVGVYDVDARAITYVAPGVDRDGPYVWSPDGRQIAFVRRPGRPFGARATRPRGVRAEDLPMGFVEARFPGGHKLTIWIADVETGAARELWRAPPDDQVFEALSNLRWAGRHLVFRARPGEWMRYYSIPVDRPSVEPVPLTPDEGHPEYVAYSADGQFLYFATNYRDIDRRHIWRVPIAGGDPVQITRGTGIESRPLVLASGREIAVIAAGPRQPMSIAIVPSRGGDIRRLRPPRPGFPEEAHVVPESVVLTAADGTRFHSQLFVPPGIRRGERRPAVIFMHGGPARQTLLGYHDRHFYHMAYGIGQVLASRGYIVMAVNYRGGIGYGHSFQTAPNRGGRGNSEYQDILAAGRYLQSRADVDSAGIGLWGLSYGGILTAQALARNSDVFAGGVDMAGLHLWGSTLDPSSTSYQSSSAAAIETWRSPVLLIHGDDDRNVRFSETVGLVQLLRQHAVPFELLVFPNEVHTFLVHRHWMQAFEATVDFLDRVLVRKERIAVSP